MEPANTSASPLVILWTEDDENDRLMIRVAVERSGRNLKLMFVGDGEQAWQYLMGLGPYADRTEYPVPHALVTDLKMPRCNGFELVSKVRAEETLKHLPIYVFSASDLAIDRRAAQRLGVDAYITKPTGFGVWTSTVISVLDQAASHRSAA